MLKYTLVILCVFVSCQSNKTENAKGVLTKQELTTFLIEMYLAEARLDNVPIGRDSAIKLFIPYEDKLMKKFNIADSTLKKTYQYYLEHPKEMEEIYDVLIDSLSLREQRTSH